MNILIVGDKKKAEQLQKILPNNAQVYQKHSLDAIPEHVDVVFDMDYDRSGGNAKYYLSLRGKVAVVSAVRKQLATTVREYSDDIACHLIGMNMMPGLIDRKLIELSLLHDFSAQAVEQLAVKFDWNIRIVEDRVGMVTPRVVCMIINEACYLLQEEAARMEDIDKAMRLGTNYPYGPFEWADKIGIEEIYETLLAIYEDTHDERYKICPLLKTKYLKKEKFYR